MPPSAERDACTDEEIERRMDNAVRRALNTPPQPHTAKRKAPNAVKVRASRKRATGGKPAPSA